MGFLGGGIFYGSVNWGVLGATPDFWSKSGVAPEYWDFLGFCWGIPRKVPEN